MFLKSVEMEFTEPSFQYSKSLSTQESSTSIHSMVGEYFTPKSQKVHNKYTVEELVKQFIQFSEGKGSLSPKTLQQYRRHLQIFIDLWPFKDLNEIDRENAELLLLLLYKFPKNPEKNPVLKGFKGIKLVDVCEQLSCDVISRRTVKKIVNLLSTFCNWAKNRGHVDENPFHRLKVKQALTTDCRYQFSNDELTRVFAMKDYQKCKYLHSYYYWIPLLLRFTGARLNELCQLYKADIVRVNKIWGIRICAKNKDQRLKNNNSMRFVPLHHAVISRGFLEFVESCTSDRLFSELPLVNGYFSHYASKWFARRRKDLGLGKGKDAHSFRHSFIDELKQQEVAIDIVQELVGHSSNSITTSVYSRSYKPELLAAAISKIDDSHVAAIKPYAM
ncbi:site-specific integrase [Vibrio parahaemolyticus]|uniref:site-specific integrase n=1 Tax=Vibrio parahaemolyticus TaxID=670 RepID=UPI00067D9778|nr:site-specific integrase [Vibrio parahaemolyticus]